MKEGIAINEFPSTLKVFTSCYWGEEVLEKVILVLEKSLIFSQKILYDLRKRMLNNFIRWCLFFACSYGRRR